jgi:hypothetical protein
MIEVTVDAGVARKLKEVQEHAELRDESGRFLGHFHPRATSEERRYDGCYIPNFKEEDVQRWEAQPGRPLELILVEALPSRT